MRCLTFGFELRIGGAVLEILGRRLCTSRGRADLAKPVPIISFDLFSLRLLSFNLFDLFSLRLLSFNLFDLFSLRLLSFDLFSITIAGGGSRRFLRCC